MQYRNSGIMSRRTIPHFLKTLRLLRERLLSENNQALTTSTVSAILALAAHALYMGDFESSKYHLGGLRKIVSLRGGVATFSDNAKLLIEILRYVPHPGTVFSTSQSETASNDLAGVIWGYRFTVAQGPYSLTILLLRSLFYHIRTRHHYSNR